MARQSAGLFENHDRGRFEVTAIALGEASTDGMRMRLERAFECFVAVQGEGDEAVARLMREREIDIAVDLTGYTAGARTGILALRPAPVQVNYLGFPGTMGAGYIDYILADRFVIPEARWGDYAERVVWLPECFQVNDGQRERVLTEPSRAAEPPGAPPGQPPQDRSPSLPNRWESSFLPEPAGCAGSSHRARR